MFLHMLLLIVLNAKLERLMQACSYDVIEVLNEMMQEGCRPDEVICSGGSDKPALRGKHAVGCKNPQASKWRFQAVVKTPRLEKLKIEDCPSLTSLWSSSGNLPKALRYLSVTQCSKLELIAKGKCPSMVSIPEGGPISLTFLGIGDANICKSLLEWGLHRLMPLEFLGIEICPGVISFSTERDRNDSSFLSNFIGDYGFSKSGMPIFHCAKPYLLGKVGSFKLPKA
ncbi:hypothetical protein EZV62_017337 [Acer yangbiense]|uniref:Uncharacterized protein n=1 Tax=Acer yangbiense TaxID=1000413 RepID=A0A5C7HGE7_9ROSI|nr:hypothetical protein EZV62_017337 [Acer yangbiense]